MRNNVRYITEAALIAAIYAVITIVFAPISYGNNAFGVEFRISEALTVLPALTPAAIPGLFVGCIVANLYGGNGIYDVIIGSLATLLAAYLSYKMPRKYLVPLPPILINGLVVGTVLHFVLQIPLWIAMLSVAVGEAVVCYALGYPLLVFLTPMSKRIFSGGKKQA